MLAGSFAARDTRAELLRKARGATASALGRPTRLRNARLKVRAIRHEGLRNLWAEVRATCPKGLHDWPWRFTPTGTAALATWPAQPVLKVCALQQGRFAQRV